MEFKIEYGTWDYSKGDYPVWVVEMVVETDDESVARDAMRDISNDFPDTPTPFVKLICDGKDNAPLHYITATHPKLWETK